MQNINFSPFPILTTERLTLRQLSVDDQQDILTLRSDPEINKYLDRAPSKTLDDALSFINMINDFIQRNKSIYWVISFKDSKKVMGTICLFDFSKENNSCEIGYELMPKFQGQGIMKEATAAVIDYAFHTLQVQKIIAFTHNENLNSTKLLTKFNFSRTKEADKESPRYSIFTLASSLENS